MLELSEEKKKKTTTFQFWILCTLRLMITSVRGWSPVLCTEFLEMWTELSAKATRPLRQ